MGQTGSYRLPGVEHARVSDAMNHGIVRCQGDAGLREMGQLMASHHIHSLVTSLRDPDDWALVSDVAVAQSALGRPDATAADLAVPAMGIPDEATLIRALEVMRDRAHLAPDRHRRGRPAADRHDLGARHRRRRRLG